MSLRDAVALAIAGARSSDVSVLTGMVGNRGTRAFANWSRGTDEIFVTITSLGEAGVIAIWSVLPRDLFHAAP